MIWKKHLKISWEFYDTRIEPVTLSWLKYKPDVLSASIVSVDIDDFTSLSTEK